VVKKYATERGDGSSSSMVSTHMQLLVTATGSAYNMCLQGRAYDLLGDHKGLARCMRSIVQLYKLLQWFVEKSGHELPVQLLSCCNWQLLGRT
jgi:hypothetical protein